MKRNIKTTYCVWVTVEDTNQFAVQTLTVHSIDFGISPLYPKGVQDAYRVLFEVPGLPLESETVGWVAASLYRETDDVVTTTTYFTTQEEALNLEKVGVFEYLAELANETDCRDQIIKKLKNGNVFSECAIIKVVLP
jgi:hypothetical protein